MIRVEGLDRDALKIRENVFEGLVRKSIRMAVRALSTNLGDMLTAATATGPTPTLAVEPPPPVPTLTGAELGAVTATWGAHVTSELYPYLAQTYLDGAAATFGAVENATSITLAAVTDQFAVDYLRGAANRLRGIGDGVWTAVREQLALGYEAGDDIHQLAARVRTAANVSTPRALVIARTEVISAANAGSLTQVQLGGFTDEECQKEWLATEDARTRPAHREADGQRVGINQAFHVGDDYLQVPGDRTGHPDNVIGCRCSVAFVFNDDDDIVTGMDEPLTAGKKWTAADEAKIKRDSEGKFAKKAGSAAASGGQPIKINTKTVYQTSYNHGTVIAEKSLPGGTKKKRLVWNGNIKKFDLESRTHDADGPGKWIHVNSYTKAEAFKYFKDQIGWQTPKVAVDPAASNLKSLAADKIATPKNTSTVTVKDGSTYQNGEVVAVQEDLGAALVWDADLGVFIEWDVNADVPVVDITGSPLTHTKNGAQKIIDGESKFPWTTPAAPKIIDKIVAAPVTINPPNSTTSITSPGKPLSINTNVIYKQKYADGAVIAEKADPTVGNTRLVWSESIKKFILQGQLDDGSWMTAEVYGKGEAYKKFSKETGWQVPGSGSLLPLNTPAPGKLSPWKPVADSDDDDDDDNVTSMTYEDLTKSVAAQADTMAAQAFGKWFNLNKSEIKKLWPDFDDVTKVSMIDAAEGYDTETGDSTIFDTIKAWTPGKLNAPKATGITPTFLGPKNDDPINVMTWADWVSTGFEKSVWDSLTEQQKNDMTLAAAKAHAMGLPQALAKIKQFDGKTSSLPGGLNSVDEYNGLTADKKHEWVKNLTKADWNSLTPDQQADIFEFTEDEHATWGGLDEAMAILNLFKSGKNNVTSSTSAPPSPAPIVGTPILPTPSHAADAVEKAMSVKFVGDIGTPKTKVSYWQELTPNTANAMQEKMLEGGPGWSVPQKSAVAKYTTSEGYQTMNAVLRNDVKQLEKFNESQLNSAVNAAKHLQTAMRPLTESVILHRGTGAHAFGFDSINVSTDELKKLEGQVIADKGFVSTSVIEPTHISFDYAKKPIKIIVQAPEGTPALYVSSATPGYSHENELILGAGTSFHINEVRAASAADKIKYGSHTDQVVTVTVVPSMKSAGASTPTAPTVPSTSTTPAVSVTSPSVGGGAPLKINTNTIYKQTYAHGAVIAVKSGHKNADGKARRLFWNENLKKFVLQQEIAPGSWVGSLTDGQYTFNKKDAYAKFSKETDWETPPTGMSALVTSTGPTTLPPSSTPVPSVSTTATPPVSAPKLKSIKAGVKLSKFTADQLQTQAATPPNTLTVARKISIYKHFKAQPDTGLSGSPTAAFGALFETLNWHNDEMKVLDPSAQLSMLQLIKVIDEQGAFYAKKTNEDALAKKIIDWLKTPAGQRSAQGLITPSLPVIKSGFIDPAALSKLPKVVQATLLKMKDPSSIGTPNTTATIFNQITSSDATAMQKKMLAAPSSEQQNAIGAYTGSGYSTINALLRGKTAYGGNLDYYAEYAVSIQSAMKPITQSITVYRGTGPEQFPGLTYMSGFNDIKAFEGTVIKDPGFVSTSVYSNTAFSNKVRMEIELPEGTPAMYVKAWSTLKGENEMLLAAGLKYHVVSVTNEGSGITKVKLRVVPW